VSELLGMAQAFAAIDLAIALAGLVFVGIVAAFRSFCLGFPS
jgi:hypothetical protein